ncbi:LAGLIDADG family homing endonuclease [Streptomyces sp. NBRC 110035]|uniref:LAGLIDADG family homing endonuclease n=1 Tax=Streptomyces sp. NBRC 110035 TaxID=1547867 RepID=UPI000ADDAD87|nr:LAGLIDADG family homing endonuclease [Streptomyces sp. NBRC 110035]
MVTPTLEQAEAIDAYGDGLDLVLQAGAGCGKALRTDQPVLTPTGWRPIGTLAIDDPIIGRDGLIYEVSGVYPQGIRPLYELRFSDGVTVIADAEHRWLVQSNKQRDRGTPGQVLTTAEILARGVARPGGGGRWFVPMPDPVKLPEAELPLDPWLLGLLLGDGSLSGTVTVTTADAQIIDRVRALVDPMGVVVYDSAGRYGYGLGGRQTLPGRRGFWNPIVDALRSLGLRGLRSHEKFVPDLYKFASADQRLEVLRGLLDADGHRAHGDAAEYVTTSLRLAEDVRWLVQSLGGTATLTEKATRRKLAYRMRIKLPAHLVPFFLERKASGWCEGARVAPFRAIRAITPVEPDEAVCISVTAPDHLYLTAGCVPTHNSSTLKLIAQSDRRRRMTYVAYNTAIKNDAAKSFPAAVACKTGHGLAFDPRYGRRLQRPRQTAHEAAQALDVRSVLGVIGATPTIRTDTGGQKAMTFKIIMRVALDTVTRWCHSADDEITEQHVPQYDGLTKKRARAELVQLAFPVARAAWADLENDDSVLNLTHDHYLKMWALSRPTIPTDVVLLDEAQDTNDVLSGVLLAQEHAQRIAVGDSAQQIYSWRGAKDALEGFVRELACPQLTLSQSFRFGPAIAARANVWLRLIDAPLRLTGWDAADSTVGTLATPDAILCRTNAGAMDIVMEGLANGRKVALVGGGGDIKRLAWAAEALQDGRPTDHPELMGFPSWDAVRQYAAEEDGSLEVLVKLIDEHGTDSIIAAADGLCSEQQAELVVSTAHRSKGREWPAVRIHADFRAPKPDQKTGLVVLPREEARLAYVAVTRARKQLDDTALAWVSTVAAVTA